MRFCTAMFLKVERRRQLALNHHVRRGRSRAARIAFAQTDEFKHTREVHVWLLAQGVDERKWEARRNSNVSSVSQSVGEWSQSADARAFAIESPQAVAFASSQQRRTHSKSLLSSVRPSPTLASMARTASSCWQERDASSARHASLSTHRCCDAKCTRARTAPSTPSAVQGVAACYRVRRATDR